MRATTVKIPNAGFMELAPIVSDSPNLKRKINSAFFSEGDTAVDKIKDLASIAKCKPVELYTAILLEKAFAAAFERVERRMEQNLSAQIQMLLEDGLSREEAIREIVGAYCPVEE